MSISIPTDRPILSNRDHLTLTVAKFWNKISRGWSMIWGPHIHHGYYDLEALTPIQAQERLIEKLMAMLPKIQGKILDVGCGMGGSSLRLAERYSAEVQGVTLSAEQVKIATRRAELLGAERVHFKVEDALSLASIPDGSIDLVWSLESCEQFYDKDLFLKQALRVLKPGGHLMLATWCSSDPVYHAREAKQYQKLCQAFDVPYMPTLMHYLKLLRKNNFRIEKVADWSKEVAPSWQVGVSLVTLYSFFKLLRMGGWRGWRFSRQIKLMRNGFREGRVCYGVFVAEKLRW